MFRSGLKSIMKSHPRPGDPPAKREKMAQYKRIGGESAARVKNSRPSPLLQTPSGETAAGLQRTRIQRRRGKLNTLG